MISDEELRNPIQTILREIYEKGKAEGRAEAIDEFYNRLLDNKNEINASNYPWNYIELVARKMTDQLNGE